MQKTMRFNQEFLDYGEAMLAELTAEAERTNQSNPTPESAAHLARMQELNAFNDYQGDDRVILLKEYEEEMDGMPLVDKLRIGESFPFPKLLLATDGFDLGELVVISAQQKSGKTKVIMQMAEGMEEEAPLYFLFEEPPRVILKKLKSKGLPTPHLYIPHNNNSNTMQWICDRMMESIAKNGSRVFFIDNFDWLQKTIGRGDTNEMACSQILHQLKTFCNKWQVVIFLVAHTVQMPKEEFPGSHQIKGTSAFKQIASIVIMLWRKTMEVEVDGMVATNDTKSFHKKVTSHVRTNETVMRVAENRRNGDECDIHLEMIDGLLVEQNKAIVNFGDITRNPQQYASRRGPSISSYLDN